MKERPILFSGEMVRAVLENRKTQTRRVIKFCKKHKENLCRSMGGGYHTALQFGKYGPEWSPYGSAPMQPFPYVDGKLSDSNHIGYFCPYGKTGDRLWVRETWRAKTNDDCHPAGFIVGIEAAYKADLKQDTHFDHSKPWKPSIHMPRWASRITLEITNVRVERLQDISHEDAKAEGVERCLINDLSALKRHGSGAIALFKELWETLNGPGSWEKNPWVWVIEFKKVKP